MRTLMGGLRVAALDRWITEGAPWLDDEVVCAECGEPCALTTTCGQETLCDRCAEEIAATEREVERLIDEAEAALDEQLRAQEYWGDEWRGQGVPGDDCAETHAEVAS